MATTNILAVLMPHTLMRNNPGTARVEERIFLDATTSLPTIKRCVIVFPKTGTITPDLLFEFVMPPTYAATTGVTLQYFGMAEPPFTGTQGNVRLDFALENLTSDTASNPINADSFGTPIAGTFTPSTTVWFPKSGSLALVKANAGPQASVAGSTLQLCRGRLRRLNTDALDTLNGNFLITGMQLIET